MGSDLKRLQMCRLLFFFCGWVALSQGTSTHDSCMSITCCEMLQVAEHSMSESKILDELAEAATKNQGGSKAIKGIKGLKVKDIQPPVVHMSLVKDTGMSMVVRSQITIAGKSFIGGTMEITVVSDMKTTSKMIVEKPDLSQKGKKTQVKLMVLSCKVDLISCKTNLPSSMLPKIVNKFLNSTLGKVLPGMMCPAADKVVAQMQKKMESLWVPQQMGSLGTIEYYVRSKPTITEHHIHLCFETLITRTSGEELEIPTEPPASEDLPELENEDSEFTMPVNLLNAVMGMYGGVLDQDVTSDMVDGNPEISAEALKERLPMLEIPEDHGELKVKMSGSEPLTWSLEEGEAALILHLSAEVMEGTNSLCTFAVEVKIFATFQVVEGKLHPSLGESRLENLQEISNVLDSFDPEPISTYLMDLIRAITIPAIKTALQDGIPLPSMMGSSYGATEMEIHKNTLRGVVSSSCE